MIWIGEALAGHAFRATNHPKARKYDNPFVEMVDLIIAEVKAKQSANATDGSRETALQDGEAE